MILVEGIDGSGKTGLVRRLSEELKIPIHERASTSLGGPVKNVHAWAMHDVKTLFDQPLSVYDRHPLISEMIYGPIIRPKQMDPAFYTEETHDALRTLMNNSLVIFCNPGFVRVDQNVLRNSQMLGVVEKIRPLFQTYRLVSHFWMGQKLVWDYRYLKTFPALKLIVETYKEKWEESYG